MRIRRIVLSLLAIAGTTIAVVSTTAPAAQAIRSGPVAPAAYRKASVDVTNDGELFPLNLGFSFGPSHMGANCNRVSMSGLMDIPIAPAITPHVLIVSPTSTSFGGCRGTAGSGTPTVIPSGHWSITPENGRRSWANVQLKISLTTARGTAACSFSVAGRISGAYAAAGPTSGAFTTTVPIASELTTTKVTGPRCASWKIQNEGRGYASASLRVAAAR